MTIEIHNPELEALIRQRMESGAFEDVEDVLLHALYSSSLDEPRPAKQKVSLARFLLDSPLAGSGLKLERAKDSPRPVDL
jgi:hypothetical protein